MSKRDEVRNFSGFVIRMVKIEAHWVYGVAPFAPIAGTFVSESPLSTEVPRVVFRSLVDLTL